jgi:hypothetical protein
VVFLVLFTVQKFTGVESFDFFLGKEFLRT